MSVNAVWFEIPSSDFDRAVRFYEAVFQVSMKREKIGGQMAVFPTPDGVASGAIVEQQPGYLPSSTGAVIYLNSGADLSPLLTRATQNGGKVLLQKTALPPGMGHFAHIQDSEGNRIGLHSIG
jgi:uncharacterized protein